MDRRAIEGISTVKSGNLDQVFVFITYTGATRAWVLLACTLWVVTLSGITVIPNQREFLHAMLAGLLAWGAGFSLKYAIRRKRPSEAIEGFVAKVKSPKGESFPSNHTASSAGFFLALLLAHHPYAPGIGLWAGVVAFSRFYLGVHYPTDIVGGVAVGLICAFGQRVMHL